MTPSTTKSDHSTERSTSQQRPKSSSLTKTIPSKQQQQSPQKPSSTSSTEVTSVKKMIDVKASQQKPQKSEQQQKRPISPHNSGLEVEMKMRTNVRKNLAELLKNRLKNSKDTTLNGEQVTQLSVQIEIEMFKLFANKGSKYKAKYRSLVFNIKDTKNLTLWRKIIDGSLTPSAVVNLSPEEMANQELAKWREKENKNQLEMLKKTELELLAASKSRIIKTHKGEQVIENQESNVDPLASMQDIARVFDRCEDTHDEKKEKKKKDHKEKDRDKNRHKSHDKSKKRHRSNRSKDRSSNKKFKKEGKKETEKSDKDKHKHSSRHQKKDHKKKDEAEQSKKEKKEEEKENKMDTDIFQETEPTEEIFSTLTENETADDPLDDNFDIRDTEPTSTVKSPDINIEIEKEVLVTKTSESTKTTWTGYLHLTNVAKTQVTAEKVSGNARDIFEKLPETLDVIGRINHVSVWDYLEIIKKNAVNEVLVIRFTVTSEKEKCLYDTLWNHYNNTERLGVLGSNETHLAFLKDFYLIPFSKGSRVSSLLLLNDFEKDLENVLLGVIVFHNEDKPYSALTATPAPKTSKKVPSPDSSSTPSKTSERDPKQNPTTKIAKPQLSSRETLESPSSPDDNEPPVTLVPNAPKDNPLPGCSYMLSRMILERATQQQNPPTVPETLESPASPDEIQNEDAITPPRTPVPEITQRVPLPTSRFRPLRAPGQFPKQNPMTSASPDKTQEAVDDEVVMVIENSEVEDSEEITIVGEVVREVIVVEDDDDLDEDVIIL